MKLVCGVAIGGDMVKLAVPLSDLYKLLNHNENKLFSPFLQPNLLLLDACLFPEIKDDRGICFYDVFKRKEMDTFI